MRNQRIREKINRTTYKIKEINDRIDICKFFEHVKGEEALKITRDKLIEHKNSLINSLDEMEV